MYQTIIRTNDGRVLRHFVALEVTIRWQEMRVEFFFFFLSYIYNDDNEAIIRIILLWVVGGNDSGPCFDGYSDDHGGNTMNN